MDRLRPSLLAAGVAVLSLSATAARAAALSVSSITPIDLGTVVSAPSGNTVFTIDSAGNVTRYSGSGVRMTTGSTRSLVTITCGSDNNCNDKVYVRVGDANIHFNRGGDLSNFTMHINSGRVATSASGSDPISFTLDALGKNGSASFYIGTNFAIAGDDSGKASGIAASAFYVYVGFSPGPTSGSVSGAVGATIYRPLSLTETGLLDFGRVIRPVSGTGDVDVDADQGAYHLSGISVMPRSVSSRAVFTAGGEGGRSFSISVPHDFALTRSGGTDTLTVTTSSNAGSTANFSGSSGSAGSYVFGVGGSINVSNTTPLGTYTGSFTVTIGYN